MRITQSDQTLLSLTFVTFQPNDSQRPSAGIRMPRMLALRDSPRLLMLIAVTESPSHGQQPSYRNMSNGNLPEPVTVNVYVFIRFSHELVGSARMGNATRMLGM
jgi:hypothetical protein